MEEELSLSDEKLIERAKAGEEELYNVLYRRCVVYVNYLVNNVVIESQMLRLALKHEDLTGLVLIKIFEEINKYDQNHKSGAKFKTWVNKVALNYLIGYTKKKTINIFVSENEEEEPFLEKLAEPTSKINIYDKIFITDVVNVLLKTLENMKSTLLRDTLFCKFTLLMSDAAIAECFDVTEGCVRANICRGLYAFQAEFVEGNNKYKEINFKGLSEFIREGGLCVTSETIQTINNKKLKEVLKALTEEKLSLTQIAKLNKISKKEAGELIKEAISELLRKGIVRSTPKTLASEPKITDDLAQTICKYITMLLNNKKQLATRSTPITAEVAHLESIAEVLAALSGVVHGWYFAPLNFGIAILKQTESKNMSLTKTSTMLGVSKHTLAQMLSNTIPQSQIEDKSFLSKAAQFLGISDIKIKELLQNTCQQVSPNFETRGEMPFFEPSSKNKKIALSKAINKHNNAK